MTDSVDARLRRVEDSLAIQELVARYALAVDDHDMDALAALYATDAVFEGLTGTLHGRWAVTEYVASKLDTYDGASVHTPHSPVIEFGEDGEAVGIVPAHVEFSEGGVQRNLALRYHDRYTRRDGTWYFQSREIRVVYSVPTAGNAGALPGAPA